MMTDTAIQQSIDTNGQTLVTQSERQALIQKLNTKWALDLSTRVENLAYEKSRGIKPIYFKMVQTYYQQVQNAHPNRSNPQQQPPPQPQQTLQSLNTNGQYLNQQINLSQQPSAPMLGLPQHQLNSMLNQQSRFPSVPQSIQPRMTNPQTGILNNQAGVLNQGTRLREAQKFNQSPLNAISYTSSPLNTTPSSIQTMDLPQNYTSQQPMNNSNLNDYLSPSTILQNRYLNQSSPINQRSRSTTNLNGSFSQQSSTNNSSDILHQFVVSNLPTNTMTTPMTNTSSNGDRLLQQILLANNIDGTSNKMPLQNRQPSLQQTMPTIMPQPIRSVNTMNSNLNPSVHPLRPSLPSQQTSPSPPVIIMPTPPHTSNIPIQSSPNVPNQQSPLNNNNGSFSSTSQVIPQPPSVTINNTSTSLLNNYPSPLNRSLPSTGSGSISSPDEETINLIKFLKDNISKLQSICQRFTTEGNLDKARNAQALHQQMLQFINNPTYESLANARHIRDMLERASNRSQPVNPPTTNVPIPPAPIPQINELNQFAKVLTEYISRDQKKRLVLNKLFVEPLSDVINGVPHKKIRLDHDSNSMTNQKISSSNQYSLLSNLNDELNLLPANLFSIERLPVSHTIKNVEFDDEYLSKNGMVLRCKLLEPSNPLILPLRIRLSTRYPDDPPEILSLTKSMPPKLEFTDGHPFFEQLSTIFVSHLFKLPSQYTVTDILHIWHQSVQSAL